MSRDPDEPMAWIPGESDFANAQYLSRPYTWPTMTPEEARSGRSLTPVCGRAPSPIADFLFPAPFRIE